MENEIIPTPPIPQEPIIPPEIIKPKKKILLPIIIGIIFILLIGIIFYQQKQIVKSTTQKPVVSNIPTTEATKIPTITSVPTIDKNAILQEMIPFLNPNNSSNTTYEITKNEGNYYLVDFEDPVTGGALILKKEGEKYRILLSIEANLSCEIVFKENIPPALVNNSCYNETTSKTWNYNIKSNKWENELDSLKTELLPFINPNNNPNFTFEIKKTELNFALVGYDNAWHILKKEAGVWKHLIGVNGDWICDVIFKENIPPVLVEYGCIYSANGQAPYFDFYKYNTVSNKWEKQ